MESVSGSKPVISAQPSEGGAVEAHVTGDAAEREGKHEEEQLDEVLVESFPASDPPSSWAGA